MTNMTKTFRYTILCSSLLASTVLFTACESKGPGEIGSLNDVVVRNAGDPPIEKALAAEPTQQAEVDPMIAEHEKAVEEVQQVIDEQAANDSDDTIVPGEPAETEKSDAMPIMDEDADVIAQTVEKEAVEIASQTPAKIEPKSEDILAAGSTTTNIEGENVVTPTTEIAAPAPMIENMEKKTL